MIGRKTRLTTITALLSLPVLLLVGLASAAGSFALPDGRAWEQVSPVNKHGAHIEVFSEDGSVMQAAEGGDGFSYAVTGSITGEPEGNRASEQSQVLARRGARGWETQDLTTPEEEPHALHIGELSEYRLFSSDLSQGLVVPKGAGPLPPLAAGAQKTIYLRSTAAGGGYVPLVTAENTVPGASFGEELEEKQVKALDATPDLSHVVFESSERLTLEAAPHEFPDSNLYEWTRDGLPGAGIRLVSDVHNQVGLGHEDRNVRHAISSDGDRIVWTEHAPGKPEQLMIRDMSRGETARVDVRQEGVTEPNSGVPFFQTASSDGSRVFFTDGERLTSVSRATDEEQDLYVFQAPRGGALSAGTLKDLTVALNPGETAGVQGELLGAGESGDDVYFVANGVLAPGATPGTCRNDGRVESPSATCNLYVDRYDEAAGEWEPPRFIATLSNADETSWGGSEFQQKGGLRLSADVSPNGRFLAFMSSLSLTGYDNHDAVSGVPDQEVYEYDAGSGGAGSLICASCNPTGAQPVGVHQTRKENPFPLFDDAGMFSGEWLAGSIAGWTNIGLTIPPMYQSRYLSDEGRLFFDSADALVAEDSNGVGDAYEFEPLGLGPEGHRCERGTALASDLFSAAADGCVGLISAGTSGQESVFMDASAGGGDVFFLTSSSLVPSDVDSSYDVYDAHECTAASPCPAPAPAEAVCMGTEACRGALQGAPGALESTPASQTFSGLGNIAALPPAVAKTTKKKTVKCAKGKTRDKHGRCVKAKRKAKRAGRDRRTQA